MSFELVLREGLAAFGLAENAEGEARLAHLAALLEEGNRVMDLTAITEPEQVASRHMLDSLFLLTCADLARGKLLDVGCGAGFPGLPLKCWLPQLNLTLLDSTSKRIDFVSRTAQELGVPVTAVAARAEEYVRQRGMRGGFDFVTSRAVADLSVLSELCLPYLKKGGLFLAMKSANEETEQEIAGAKRAISVLGGEIEGVRVYELPLFPHKRQVLLIRKTGETPKGYPRRFAKIKAEPIR